MTGAHEWEVRHETWVNEPPAARTTWTDYQDYYAAGA